MKVFISSVISGMEEFRAAAEQVINTLGYQAIKAEDFGARTGSPRSECLKSVRSSKVVLLLLGERYGALQDSGKSATHEEYDEAKNSSNILVFIQEVPKREGRQESFVEEVQDWVNGRYTAYFSDAGSLITEVTRALHEFGVEESLRPLNEEELKAKASDGLIPSDGHFKSGGELLDVCISVDVDEPLISPRELNSESFQERVQMLSTFGPNRLLDKTSKTEIVPSRQRLRLKQDGCEISISIDGVIALKTTIPASNGGLPVIIEEEVREHLSKILRYLDALLNEVDQRQLIRHCSISYKLDDSVTFFGWRTRGEHERGGNGVSLSSIHQPMAPLFLTRPVIARSALKLERDEIAEDMLVALREIIRS